MQGADEHRPPRVELLGGAADKVGVGHDPRDDLNWRGLIKGSFRLMHLAPEEFTTDLHLLVTHPATGDLVVPAATAAVVVGAVVEEILDLEGNGSFRVKWIRRWQPVGDGRGNPANPSTKTAPNLKFVSQNKAWLPAGQSRR